MSDWAVSAEAVFRRENDRVSAADQPGQQISRCLCEPPSGARGPSSQRRTIRPGSAKNSKCMVSSILAWPSQ